LISQGKALQASVPNNWGFPAFVFTKKFLKKVSPKSNREPTTRVLHFLTFVSSHFPEKD
jgi:hypothetical protein